MTDEHGSRAALVLYALAMMAAASAIVISRSPLGSSRLQQDIRSVPSIARVESRPNTGTPLCRACERKQEFFEDPAGSEAFNAARRVLHDLTRLEEWDIDAWHQVLAIAADPGGMYPGLEAMEDVWLTSLAIRSIGERLWDDTPEDIQAAAESLLRDGVYHEQVCVRFQSLLAIGPLRFGVLGDDEYELAVRDLSLDVPASILAPLRRRHESRNDG